MNRTYKTDLVLGGNATAAVAAAKQTQAALSHLEHSTQAASAAAYQLERQSMGLSSVMADGAVMAAGWATGMASATAAMTVWRAHAVRDVKAYADAMNISITSLQSLQYAGAVD